jgi:hypothetical protein
MELYGNKKVLKSTKQIWYCEKCEYTCSNQSNYNKHLLTRKHKMELYKIKNTTGFLCAYCSKTYKTQSGLWKHEKNCNFKHSEIEKTELMKTNPENMKDMFVKLINQNKELQHTLLEQQTQLHDQQENYQKQIGELIPMLGNNNQYNSNNKFNINVFLNEQCKDAININEFIESLQIQLQDLEYTKDNGLVNSISNIFIKGLNELDVYKRPIHCSDTKRDILYIKDEETWEKHLEKDKIKEKINELANKQRVSIKQWTDAHPNWMDDEKLKDEYVKLVNQLMQPLEDIDKDQNKIIKNISKTTYLDK